MDTRRRVNSLKLGFRVLIFADWVTRGTRANHNVTGPDATDKQCLQVERNSPDFCLEQRYSSEHELGNFDVSFGSDFYENSWKEGWGVRFPEAFSFGH